MLNTSTGVWKCMSKFMLRKYFQFIASKQYGKNIEKNSCSAAQDIVEEHKHIQKTGLISSSKFLNIRLVGQSQYNYIYEFL